jgi:hypothetical protein
MLAGDMGTLKAGAVIATLLASGCGFGTWSAGRSVASSAIACPASSFDAFVPHHYNLGPMDHVYRGCGRDVVVRCTQSSAETICIPVYVSPRATAKPR